MKKIHTDTTGENKFYYVEESIGGIDVFVCSFSPDFEDYWIVDDLNSDTPLHIDGYEFSLED